MKFPNFITKKSIAARALIVVVGLFIAISPVMGQKRGAAVIAAAPSSNAQQCHNGGASTPNVPCTGAAWSTTTSFFATTHWKENQFTPYRILLDNLVPGLDSNPSTHVYTVVIGYDVKNSGKHAFDYLGTYNSTDAGTDPCSGVIGCSGWAVSTSPIPDDTLAVTNQTNPNLAVPITQIPGQVFTLWGGTIRSVSYSAISGPLTNAQVERQITITFTAQVINPVLAWSGHIAWAGDWGVGNTAGDILGEPYQMRNKGVDTEGINQTLQLSAEPVGRTGAVFVRVAVLTPDCHDFAPNTLFPFTSSSALSPTFNLVDSDENLVIPQGPCNPTADPDTFGRSVSAAVTNFGNTIQVSELQSGGGLPGAPPGWTLLRAGCIESGIQNSTPPASLTSTISINVELDEIVVCGFVNAQLGTTAAPASVTRRVVTTDGQPLGVITLRLTDLSTGEIRVATSTTFGYYTFDGLTVLDFYQLTVTSKRYRFQNASRNFTLTDDMAGVDFFCTSQ